MKRVGGIIQLILEMRGDEMKKDSIWRHKRTKLALAAIIAGIGAILAGESTIFEVVKDNIESIVLIVIALMGLFTVDREVKEKNGKR